jgi:hypothetical protein
LLCPTHLNFSILPNLYKVFADICCIGALCRAGFRLLYFLVVESRRHTEVPMNSQPHGFEDLRDRVLRLEKQNRRLKQLGVAALIIPAILLVMGQAPSRKTVEANEFVLRDDNGNIRAKLFMTKKITTKATTIGDATVPPKTINPFAMLSLYDDKGKVVWKAP